MHRCGIFLYCVNICCWDWFNKEVDWSVTGQDKVRRENQTLGRRAELGEAPARHRQKIGGAR